MPNISCTVYAGDKQSQMREQVAAGHVFMSGFEYLQPPLSKESKNTKPADGKFKITEDKANEGGKNKIPQAKPTDLADREEGLNIVANHVFFQGLPETAEVPPKTPVYPGQRAALKIQIPEGKAIPQTHVLGLDKHSGENIPAPWRASQEAFVKNPWKKDLPQCGPAVDDWAMIATKSIQKKKLPPKKKAAAAHELVAKGHAAKQLPAPGPGFGPAWLPGAGRARKREFAPTWAGWAALAKQETQKSKTNLNKDTVLIQGRKKGTPLHQIHVLPPLKPLPSAISVLPRAKNDKGSQLNAKAFEFDSRIDNNPEWDIDSDSSNRL